MTKVNGHCECSISIVIPTFNEDKYLHECLISLQKQDYSGDYEIIVADNGSTDQTTAIAKNLGFIVVSCLEQKSATYARQIGATVAQGEIIVQADADTIYPKDWLKKIAECFSSKPDIVAVAGRYIYKNPPSWANVEYFLKSILNRLTILLFGRPMIISGANFAFRRKEFISGNGYLGLSCYPDQFGISSRLSKQGKVYYDENIYVFTSSRRIQKPFLFIINDTVFNAANLAVSFCKWIINTMYRSLVLRPLRRFTAYIFLFLIAIILFSVLAGTILLMQFFGTASYETDISSKVIASSSDDSPNESYTSQIPTIISEFGIRMNLPNIGQIL